MYTVEQSFLFIIEDYKEVSFGKGKGGTKNKAKEVAYKNAKSKLVSKYPGRDIRLRGIFSPCF